LADVAVIGGGPSGMMAAVASSKAGRKTVLLERMDRVGRKLLATGNGRCNLANQNLALDRFHGGSPDFARRVLSQFGLEETLAFFGSLGLDVKRDEAGRIFPATDQASAVLDLLRYEMRRLNVAECCGIEIAEIIPADSGFRLRAGYGSLVECRALVLAAGGKAAPGLGSNGSGFALAQSLGHAVSEPRPSLVQIRLGDGRVKRLRGVRLNAAVSLLEDGNVAATESGEVLFTDDGLSGIPALDLSRHVEPIIRKGKTPVLQIDLFPRLDEEGLALELEKRFRMLGYKNNGDACVGLLHKRMIPPLLETAGLDGDVPSGTLGQAGIRRLARCLKKWTFAVAGIRSWNEAQVTAGGVETGGIDQDTLESKTVPGLFFAGEILDVDGDCGGYNLQWAWSSGHVAGMNAARRAAGARIQI
jgi:predicted Rossmann fold flavoprotein